MPCSRHAGFFLAGAVALVAAAPVLAVVYSDRPPPAHTGGFNEPTCHSCHFDNPLNAPGGELALEGAPAAYTPGERYRLTVLVTRPGAARGGFQLAARFAEGEAAGEQAGALQPLDERAVVTEARGIQYLHQTAAGAALTSPDSARWSFEWTAPEAPHGAVVFHLSGNAGNDDDSVFGDFIYTASAEAGAENRVRK